jgi:hypothetical protein
MPRPGLLVGQEVFPGDHDEHPARGFQPSGRVDVLPVLEFLHQLKQALDARLLLGLPQIDLGPRRQGLVMRIFDLVYGGVRRHRLAHDRLQDGSGTLDQGPAGACSGQRRFWIRLGRGGPARPSGSAIGPGHRRHNLRAARRSSPP